MPPPVKLQLSRLSKVHCEQKPIARAGGDGVKASPATVNAAAASAIRFTELSPNLGDGSSGGSDLSLRSDKLNSVRELYTEECTYCYGRLCSVLNRNRGVKMHRRGVTAE
jgi:hypothetical protein